MLFSFRSQRKRRSRFPPQTELLHVCLGDGLEGGHYDGRVGQVRAGGRSEAAYGEGQQPPQREGRQQGVPHCPIFDFVLCDCVVLLYTLSLSRWLALAGVNMLWHQPVYYA